MTGRRDGRAFDGTGAAGLAVPLEVTRGAYGLVQLGRPGTLPKLLGARLVLQGAVTLLASDADRSGRRALHELGGAVDTLHSASMLGLAICSRSRRREGIQQAAAAGAFAAAEVVVARSFR
ncbi:MAG: hypothetical protein ACTHJJ_18250 [Intrasporangium sp.]|uniref:hypothetical protein n=1 Tax=Intrasporangium sp. TaxID=1925024 RepID=UPI003F80F520